MKLKNNGLDWDDLLPKMEKLFSAGKTYTEVSKELGINFSSAKRGAEKLHLDYKPDRNPWTEDEINELRNLLIANKSYQDLEKIFLGRHTLHSIKGIIKYRGEALNLKYSGNVRHFMTEDEISKAIVLVNEGLSYGEIGRKLGCDPKSVKRELSLRGKSVLSRSEKLKLGFVKGKGFIGLTEEVLQDLIGEKGLPYYIVAEQFGVDSSTVERRSKILGIKPPVKEEKEVIKSHRRELVEKLLGRELEKGEKLPIIGDIVSKELIESAYIESNYKSELAAESIGISVSEFQKLINKFGIIRPHIPQLKDYPEEFYRKLYVEDGLSYGDIAEIVGLSTDTVRKYLCKVFPEAKKTGRYLSMGEKMVGQVLEELNIPFTYNKRLSSQNPEDPDKIYIIDFVFKYKNKQVWIEYNGAQHYKFIEYFYKTRDRYEAQLERDRFVEELATKLGINLLIIPYTKDTSSLVKESVVNYLNTIT